MSYKAISSVRNKLECQQLEAMSTTEINELINKIHADNKALREELAALRAENVDLIWGLKDAKLFAVWVECLGRTDCEIYKHELEANANQSIERIDEFLDNEDGS